jgi:hypothetical protein
MAKWLERRFLSLPWVERYMVRTSIVNDVFAKTLFIYSLILLEQVLFGKNSIH